MSNTMSTVSKSSRKGSKTDASTTHQSSAMSTHSSVKGTPTHIRAWLESSVLASHVNPSVSQEREEQRTIPGTAGLKHSTLFAELDQGTACWRMLEDSYRGSTGTLKRYSKTWPRAGMMRGGKLYQLPKWERRISETDSGLWPLIPTTSAWDGKRGPAREYNPSSKSQKDRNLNTFARIFPEPGMWPTPAARDWKDGNYPSERKRHTPPLAVHAGGTLNPEWVEWLMGWPIGWTDLKPLEMDRYQLWLRLHLGY